jgi:hypothetical protein
MLDPTTAEFWTIVAGVITLLSFLGILAAWMTRQGLAYWRRPVVLVHYWWETVIDHDQRVLSPFLTVGSIRPVGGDRKGWWEGDDQLERRFKIAQGWKGAGESFKKEWLVLPGFQIATRHSAADGIEVLRVVIHNQSRNKIINRDLFDSLRIEINSPPKHVHGWRYGRLGPSVQSDQLELELVKEFREWGPTQVEISIPKALEPEDTVRDDLTISIQGYVEHQVEIRKASNLGIWIKPWKPATSRRWWQVPGRVIRWIRKAEKPRLYAPHGR